MNGHNIDAKHEYFVKGFSGAFEEFVENKIESIKKAAGTDGKGVEKKKLKHWIHQTHQI